MKNKSILLVEDDSLVKNSIIRDFKKTIDDEKIGMFKGNVQWADSVDQAFALYQANYFDLIILDLRLGKGGDGLDLLKKVRDIDQLTPIMVLSGQAEATDHHVIGKYLNTYYFDKNFVEFGTGNPRLERCIECLRDAEKLSDKCQFLLYIPQVLSSRLFGHGVYGTEVLKISEKDIVKYQRSPGDSGIIGMINELYETISENIKIISSEVYKNSTSLKFKKLVKRLSRYSLKKIEPFLNLEPNYREHYNHQFQNFLLGCVFYDKFESRINKNIREIFERSSGVTFKDDHMLTRLFTVAWFFTAMFHDNAYIIQYFDKVLSLYFKEFFHYRFPPTQIDVDSIIHRENLMPFFTSIADDFWKGESWREEFDTLLRHQFADKNHAIHSAIALRKLIRSSETDEKFSKLFTPVYTAIALHDWKVWSKSMKIQEFIEKNREKFKYDDDFQYNLNFSTDLEKNPLLHLLILVDTLQVWGRSVGGKPFEKTNRLELIDIKDEIDCNIESLVIKLNVREGENPETSPEIFCKFCQTFKTLSVILGSDGLPVKIILNRGPKHKSKKSDPQSYVEFRLGIGEQINCKDTQGCPWNE